MLSCCCLSHFPVSLSVHKLFLMPIFISFFSFYLKSCFLLFLSHLKRTFLFLPLSYIFFVHTSCFLSHVEHRYTLSAFLTFSPLTFYPRSSFPAPIPRSAAVQEERQRNKEREGEVESTSAVNEEMPVEKILEAEMAVEQKTELHADGSSGGSSVSSYHVRITILI